MSAPFPCEPTCGEPRLCPNPPLNCDRETWRLFWISHPSRAKYSRPLSHEAAQRRGAR